MPRYRCPICHVGDNPKYVAMKKVKGKQELRNLCD